MNELAMSFDPTSIEVNNGMVNLTKMCQSQGKRLDVYLKSQSTKQFLSTIDMLTPNGGSIVVATANGGEKGTFGPRKVAIHLAMWISPQFASFAIDKLQELFETGTTTIRPVLPENYLEALKALVVVTEEKQALENRLEHFASKAYTYSNSELCQAMQFKTTTQLNKFLVNVGVIEKNRYGKYVLTKQYINRGIAELQPGITEQGIVYHTIVWSGLGLETMKVLLKGYKLD